MKHKQNNSRIIFGRFRRMYYNMYTGTPVWPRLLLDNLIPIELATRNWLDDLHET